MFGAIMDGNWQNFASSIDYMSACIREGERKKELAQAWNAAAAWKARADELDADNQILQGNYNRLRDTYMRLAALAASKGIIRFE